MARRVLRPAFVVTVTLAGACDHEQSPPTDPKHNADGATAVRRDPLRKRNVRQPLPRLEDHTGPYRQGEMLNARDTQSRVIYAASDGSCYVHVPPPPGVPIPPPGAALKSETVDCPDSMQDPAWDTCLHDVLVDLEDGGCLCLRSGNPPPPPTKAECPSESAG